VADEADRIAPDPVVLRDGYERLRERVLAGRPDGWRLGHALLTGRGLAGWIAAQAAITAPSPAATAPLGSPDPPVSPVAVAAPTPAGDYGQIVFVLAEMTLAHAA
jgi:hypothetical protein